MTRESPPPLAPVFPLPGAVLFPKVLLPLRIFEPRYKAMLREVLDSQGWLAMAHLRGARELDEEGHPDVFPVVGLGRLVNYQKADDDSFKVVLLGEHRARVKGWLQVTPFPVARLERVAELEPETGERDDLRGRLRCRLREFIPRSVDSQVLTLLDRTIRECEEIGPLVDLIAYHFLRSPLEKQRLLEVASAVDREALLLDILERQRFEGGAPGDVETA